MTKEVTKKEETALSTDVEMGEWGSEQEISSQDVMISKILPMQGSSKLIGEGKAMFGEYRDSVTGDLIGKYDTPLEFIPFHCEKFWIVSKEDGTRFKYSHREPITRQNEGREWIEEIDGVKQKNEYTMMFYVLLPKDIEKGIATPYTMQFKSTSIKGGKNLFTQMFVRNKQMKKTPASFVMNLLGSKKQKDDNTWIVLDVAVNRETKQEELAAAFDLFKAVKGGDAKVDHSDFDKPAEKSAPKKDMEF